MCRFVVVVGDGGGGRCCCNSSSTVVVILHKIHDCVIVRDMCTCGSIAPAQRRATAHKSTLPSTHPFRESIIYAKAGTTNCVLMVFHIFLPRNTGAITQAAVYDIIHVRTFVPGVQHANTLYAAARLGDRLAHCRRGDAIGFDGLGVRSRGGTTGA